MILEKLSKINDTEIEELLSKQVSKPGDRWDGGVFDQWEVINTHSTAWFFIKIANSYASPHSTYYLSENLEIPMISAVSCLLNVQHEDGTIDLHSTNFHSTPDTAFLVNYLSPVYAVLKRLERPSVVEIIEKLEKFFLNAGKCLTVGGVHTPNHRWVVCSALARLNSFFPNKKYVSRIKKWFKERIDIDSDGQYSEHSVGGYSATVDNMLLTAGTLLDRPKLLDYVRKNLDMTLYYIQPGGEVLTDASNRQDSAQIGYVSIYYLAYKYFANVDKNPEYAAVCKLIEELMPEKITRFIAELLEQPMLNQNLVTPSQIPNDYFKRFSHSGVIRIRRGDVDISVISRNPTFLVFKKGRATLQSIRLAAAFFGRRGQFIPKRAKYEDNKIILSKSSFWGYIQPKRLIPWYFLKSIINKTMKFSLTNVQTLKYEVKIIESQGKVSIEIDIDGTPHVPVSLEMNFRPGGDFSGVIPDKNLEDAFFLESGMGQYTHGDHTINFGPGIANHKWAEIRGMLPKQAGKSVYLTGYTPFKHTIELS